MSVVFSIVVGLIDISLAILSQHLLDRVLGTAMAAEFMPLIYAILAAITLGVLCKYVVKFTSVQFSANVLHRVRSRLLQKFVRVPVSYVEGRHSGDLGSRMNNDAATLEQVLENRFYEYVYHPIVFVCAFSYLFHINWKLLIFSVILMPSSSYLIGRLARPLDRMASEVQSQYGRINTTVQDTVDGVAVLKAYRLEGEFRSRFRGVLSRLFNDDVKVEKRKAWMGPVNTAQVWGTYFLCTILSAYLSAAGYITVGELLVFLVLINQLINPITALPGLISNYKLSLAAAGRIADILTAPEERIGGERLGGWNIRYVDGTPAMQTAAGAVLEAREVSFSYTPEQPVLKRIDFTLYMGRMLAIVGPSGSGKSTLLQLLCGFQEPQSGELLLYGQSLRETALEDIRASMSFVSQQSYLFPGTVADNLRMANPQASLEQVIEAAKAANAHEFVSLLPEGYHTVVEEGGANFSGGQKQRLAIARALLKEAPILVMDEPTSALDTYSEELIHRALMRIRHRRAVIVVAHRLSTIVDADQILVFGQGEIRQSGTHEELVQCEGLYRELFHAQQNEHQASREGRQP